MSRDQAQPAKKPKELFLKKFGEISELLGDEKLATAQDATIIIKALDGNEIDQYCQNTHLIITEKQFDFAKKFLAFIALTKGEEVAISSANPDHKKNHLDVYIDSGILDKNIQGKIKDTTSPPDQQISDLAKHITLENIQKFYQRLLSKRPMVFFGKKDATIDGQKEVYPDRYASQYEEAYYNLDDFISYIEMEVGALMAVNSEVEFISLANRSQNPWVKIEDGQYQKKSQLTLLVGARSEIGLTGMEGQHIMQSSPGKITEIRKLKTIRIKPCNKSNPDQEKKFWQAYDNIWEGFYQRKANELKPDEDVSKLTLDEELLITRLTESYKLLILNAISQEKKANKKAYLRISPLGDGAWGRIDGTTNDFSTTVRSACGKAVARIIKGLTQDQLESIGAIEFAQFNDKTVLDAFLTEVSPSNDHVFNPTAQDKISKDQIKLISINPAVDGSPSAIAIPVINFCHRGDINQPIPFQFLHEECKDQFPKTQDDSKLTAYLICPWDSGCKGIGNEYHVYKNSGGETSQSLQASMDPVIACASPVSLLTTNPDINPHLLKNLFVINEKGDKLTMEQFGLLQQLRKLGYNDSDFSFTAGSTIDEIGKMRFISQSHQDIFEFLGIQLIEDHVDYKSFNLTAENIEKLPKYEDIKVLIDSDTAFHQQNIPASDSDENRKKDLFENATKLNPIIPQMPRLLQRLKAQTERREALDGAGAGADGAVARAPDPRITEPQAFKILDYENIWLSTTRGNKLNTTKKYQERYGENDLAGLQEDDSLMNSDNFHNIFKEIFCHAVTETKKKSDPNQFNFQDALDALFIAKTFGGLSNQKNSEDEKYQKLNEDDFIKQIKLKFPKEKRFENLDQNKLKLYRSFSACFQRNSEVFFTTGRSKTSNKGLRLTFFPDQAIPKIVNLRDDEIVNASRIYKSNLNEGGRLTNQAISSARAWS